MLIDTTKLPSRPSLPLASPDGSASGAAPATGYGHRLLIVEDDVFVAADIEMTLRAAGHIVVAVAHSGEEAVDRALTEQPDLVIMDIRLRGAMDGIDAAIEIRRRTGIASLFCSAYSSTAMTERAAPAAPAGWLAKPYSPDQLLAAVKAALDG